MSATSFTPLAAHGTGAAVAVGGDEGFRSREDLLRDAAAIAALLPEADGASEVLVVCEDRYRFAACLLAAWHRGHAVALPPNAQEQTVRWLEKQPGIAALLHDVDADVGHDVRPQIGRSQQALPAPELAADRHIATVYTSGSTGDPQACRKSAQQLMGEAQVLARCFEIGAGDRIVATVPPHHIYGLLFSVLVPLSGGAAFTRDTPLHAETVAARIESQEASILVTVPAHLRGLAVLDEGRLPALRRCFSSGAPLPPATARMLRQRFDQLATEVLGSSETGGIAWRSSTPGALWQPLPEVSVSVHPDGRIQIESPFVEAGAPRPWVGEDRIELVEGDILRFRHLGRADDVVKVAGKRVALSALQRRLLDIDGVEDAAAMAEQSSGGRGTRVRIAVVAPAVDGDDLRAKLLEWFDPVVVPRRILRVDALPREDNGKLTRKRFLALFTAPSRPTRGSEGARFDFDILSRSARLEDGVETQALQVRVPEDLYYFRGHFEHFQLLPGVAQLSVLVMGQIASQWPDYGQPRRVLKLKFTRPILPGETVALTLVHEAAKQRVRFLIERAGVHAASGTLVFEARG